MPKLPVWGWALAAAAGAVAVGGIAYAASGGAATPASGAAGGAGTINKGPTQGAVGAVATTPVTDSTIVNATQNALALVASNGKVPGLSYTSPSNGNAADPAFVAALVVFQKWQNAQGGYSLNTAGTLDYATVAAVTTQAAA